jgi:hypothetical protein
MLTKPFVLPGYDRTRLDNMEYLLPAGPEAGKPGPGEAIWRLDTRLEHRSLINRHLML